MSDGVKLVISRALAEKLQLEKRDDVVIDEYIEDDVDSPYCPSCGHCGEDGCCGDLSKACMYGTGINTKEIVEICKQQIFWIKDAIERDNTHDTSEIIGGFQKIIDIIGDKIRDHQQFSAEETDLILNWTSTKTTDEALNTIYESMDE